MGPPRGAQEGMTGRSTISFLTRFAAWGFVIPLGWLAVASSCSADSATGRSETAPFAISETGRIQVRWSSTPDPIPVNEDFELLLELRPGPEHTELPDDLRVEVEGWMPGHGHGMLRSPKVTLIPSETPTDRHYSVLGMLFHMDGEWELRLGFSWREEAGDSFVLHRDRVIYGVRL